MNIITDLISKINQKLSDASYFYISNDPERALGLENVLKNYHIVHIDNSQYLYHLELNSMKNFCLENELKESNTMFRSSIKLIRHELFQEYFEKNKGTTNLIETFKISPAFEKAVSELNGTLVNTSATLNRKYENKISQFQELDDSSISWPKTVITKVTNYNYPQLAEMLGNKFVVQFDRGHTGEGTLFINSQDDYSELSRNFPNRIVRISEFVEGIAYTINCYAGVNQVYCAGLSCQITGIPELTTLTGATIGNDWSYRKHIGADTLEKIIADVVRIGNKMRENGYLGLFGVDFVVNEHGHFVIEVNARQAASIAMHTKIQLMEDQVPLKVLLICERLGIKHGIQSNEYNIKCNQPLEWSQTFNRAKNDMKVKYQVKMGTYRLLSDNSAINRLNDEVVSNTIFLDEDRDKPLIFQKDAYSITQIDISSFLVLAPILGKEIKKGNEIARIQMNQSAIDSKGRIKQWLKEALVAIEQYQM